MKSGILRIGLLSVFLLTFFASFAGSGSPARDTVKYLHRIDTSYLDDYKTMLTARVFFLYQPAVLAYQVPGIGDVRLVPNVPMKIGIAAFYKWFGLGLSVYSPVAFMNRDKYGTTTQIDLRLNFISNQWILEGYLQLTEGLYLRNYQAAEGAVYTSENTDMLSIGANAYWILNHRKFSTRSIFNNNELQKKSAGSFMVQLQASYQAIKSDSGLLDSQFVSDYGIPLDENPTDIRSVYMGVSPGYSYTWVFLKRMYLNSGLYPGLMWSYSEYDRAGSMNQEWTMFPFMGIRAALGYNSAKWHAGISAISKVHSLSVSGDAPFYYDAPQFRVWVGTRFAFQKKKPKNSSTFDL